MSDQDALDARAEQDDDVEAHGPIDAPVDAFDAPVDAMDEPPDVEGHAMGRPVDRPVDSPID